MGPGFGSCEDATRGLPEHSLWEGDGNQESSSRNGLNHLGTVFTFQEDEMVGPGHLAGTHLPTLVSGI